MAPSDRPFARTDRPKPKTPAERGAEFAAHQRQLKADASRRREDAVPKPASPRRRTGQGRG